MRRTNSADRCYNRARRILVIMTALAALMFTGCGSCQTEAADAAKELPAVYAHVNGHTLTILPAANSSAAAFVELLKKSDVTVKMHDYGGFEKVGPLGAELPQNNEQITTEPGDVILYQGDKITIYYDKNSWNFTRLGKVRDVSQSRLRDILGSGDAVVTFSLSAGAAKTKAGRALVVCFSRGGQTKRLAGYIAERLNTDLYEIKAAAPYTDDDINYHTDCRAGREQKDASARPGIAGKLPDLSGYDTVFIGYPIWYGQAPKIIYTFLESVDTKGKVIIPFCTSGSSPIGTSAENLHSLASGARWNEGRRFAAGTGKEEIAGWLENIGLKTAEKNKGQSFNFESHTVRLNSGYLMPIIGLGTWTLSNDDAEKTVYQALKCGMRLIDTARYYQCEKGVGRGLKRAIDEGLVARGEVFITSKIMPSDYSRAAKGIDESLSDLGLDYIDLMLIHQPGSNDQAVYKAMEDAVRKGKLRSIGISNYYTKEAVDEVLSYASVVPAVIQNENHLYYQNTELQKYVKQFGIVIESWYPFGGRGHTKESFNNKVIAALSKKYRKTPAQIILRWQLQAGFIAIPGSSDPKHIAENYDIFDFQLTGSEMKQIRGLDRHKRYENW